MTRALIWKELREQGTITVALLVLGAAILVAAAVLLDSGDSGRASELRSIIVAGRLALVLLVMTAGTVAGGTLFAGEREAGTLSFLDQLPGSRFGVWWRKVAAGGWIAVVSGGVLFAAAASLGLLGPRGNLLGWAFLIAAVTLASFGWGSLGSVIARTSLAACGIGTGLGVAAGFLVMPISMLVVGLIRESLGGYSDAAGELQSLELSLMVTSFAMIVLPLPASAWVYSAPDRSRLLAAGPVRVPGARGMARGAVRAMPTRWSLGFGRLLWLAFRQMRVPTLCLGVIAMLAGGAMTPVESMPVLVWPALSLIAGVLCGVIGLADEQSTLATRFWGDRRLPVGRVWLAKMATGGAVTFGVVLMLIVPLFVMLLVSPRNHGPFLSQLFRTGLFVEEGFPAVTYLLIWPAYGFAAGHLAALLFRKALVAGAAAILVGGTFAALWLPSLLGGGLHFWQPLLPLLALLLTARLLAWGWATDSLGTRGPLLRLAGGLVAATLATGGGLYWRVEEVPLIAQVADDVRFAESLPTFDDQQAGRDIRRSVSQFNDSGLSLLSERPEEPLYPLPDPRTPASVDVHWAYLDRMTAILENGWPTDRPDLDDWTNRVFASEWDRPLFVAAAKPTGVLEDPNELSYATPLKNINLLQRIGPLFLARGLQKQAHGDPAAFVEILETWLAVVRTVRNNAVLHASIHGRTFEALAYRALDRWLERLDGRPDLLRRALKAITTHEQQARFDPQTIRLAHQVVLRNGIDFPSRWVARYIEEVRPGGQRRAWESSGSTSIAAETEANVVGFAWTVPWEKERHRRVVGLGNIPGGQFQQIEQLEGLPGRLALERYWSSFSAPNLTESENSVIAPRRAAMLKLALRLFQAEQGRLPTGLMALVPKYLPSLPPDPYDARQPFRYRVSSGETIEYERDSGGVPSPQNLPPGRWPQALTASRLNAVAGAAGGGICWPLEPEWMGPPPPPPGVGTLDDQGIAAAAGVAGAGLYWPGANIWFDDPASPIPFWLPSAAGGPPGATMMGAAGGMASAPGQAVDSWPWRSDWPSREVVHIPVGQGILWSVGPDHSDDGGRHAGGPGIGQRFGFDLVYVVPRMPKKK